MKKPQEIREEDITRSENETTKNVAAVSRSLCVDAHATNLTLSALYSHRRM